MQKIKRLFRKLHIRFICLLCLTVIPVNLLALTVTWMVQENQKEALLQAYRNELDMLTEVLNKDFERISDNLISICDAEKLNIRNASSQNQLNMAEYTLLTLLKEQRSREDIIDVAYLKNNDTGEILLSLDNQQYPYPFEEKIKAVLREISLEDKKYLVYQLTEIAGESYLLANVSFYEYSVGFAMNTADFLALIGERALEEGRTLHLKDRAMDYEIVYGENTLRSVPKETQEVSENGWETVLKSEMMIPGIYLEEYIPDQVLTSAIPVLYRILWLVAIVSVIVFPAIWLYLRKLVLVPLKNVENAMRQIEKDQLDFRIEVPAETEEFQYLYDCYNHMAESLKTLTVEAYELELDKVRLDAINSRLQVNPHMLLNSLSMIYSLALSKDYSFIQEYSRNLMKYFRYILRKNQTLVTLKEELDFIADFLNVQKIRFPNAFTFVYKMEDELQDIQIPPFIIENFVENSIKYGLKPEETIDIMVFIRKEDEILKISIVDTGNGMTEETCALLNQGEIVNDRNGSHIGVWNCRKRIRLYYGDSAVLRISSRLTEGTQVWMELPVNTLHVEEAMDV